jgi:hypothetical protein
MGVYRWIDYSVGLAARLAFFTARWAVRHPYPAAAVGLVVVVVTR